MADIFLSYAKEDRDTARKLSMMLEQAGWTVWWDRRIPAGRTWHDVLEDALRDMRCMVVLWSSHSVESDWVKEEAEEARAVKKLLPVLIEQVNPPVGFRSIQSADLTDWDGVNESFGSRQLIADIESLIGARTPRESLEVAPKIVREPDIPAGANAGQTTRIETTRFNQSPVPLDDTRAKPPWKIIGAAGAMLVLGLGLFVSWRDGEPLNHEMAKVAVPAAPEAPAASTIVKLGVSAPRRELKPAETMNFAVRGVFADGSENEISSAVEWSSSDSQVAAVDSQGRITALQPGTAAITATHGGVTSSPWILAVKAPESTPPPKLVALAVKASKNDLAPREKVALRVTGTYSDGGKKSLSNDVVWMSSDTAVASVNAGGELETWRVGKTEVVARLGELTSAPIRLVVRESRAKGAAEPQERKGLDYLPNKTPGYAAIEKTPDARPIAPEVNPERLRAKVASYISRAKDYRVRGDYRTALAELETARASDPGNAEVRAEIEQTKRACLAEKRLGRGGLECG